MNDTMNINGVEYVRKDVMTSGRAVVVVDRGWIFAGDVHEDAGRIRLGRAVKADIRPCADVYIPSGAEICRIYVGSDWGLKNV